eukprot:Em0002g862a
MDSAQKIGSPIGTPKISKFSAFDIFISSGKSLRPHQGHVEAAIDSRQQFGIGDGLADGKQRTKGMHNHPKSWHLVSLAACFLHSAAYAAAPTDALALFRDTGPGLQNPDEAKEAMKAAEECRAMWTKLFNKVQSTYYCGPLPCKDSIIKIPSFQYEVETVDIYLYAGNKLMEDQQGKQHRAQWVTVLYS